LQKLHKRIPRNTEKGAIGLGGDKFARKKRGDAKQKVELGPAPQNPKGGKGHAGALFPKVQCQKTDLGKYRRARLRLPITT